MTAPNRQKIPDLFLGSFLVPEGAFFPGGIMTFLLLGLFYFSAEKWNLSKTRSDVFRSSISVISSPENCLRTLAVGNPIGTNNTSTESTLGETANEFSFPNLRRNIPIVNFFFCLKLELTVD